MIRPTGRRTPFSTPRWTWPKPTLQDFFSRRRCIKVVDERLVLYPSASRITIHQGCYCPRVRLLHAKRDLAVTAGGIGYDPSGGAPLDRESIGNETFAFLRPWHTVNMTRDRRDSNECAAEAPGGLRLRAILCKRLGPPSVLCLDILPNPVPGPGEVAVRVDVVGLNFFDVLLVAGSYQLKPPLPFSPGAELAGTVEAVGPNVSTVQAGDRVAAVLRYGACREKVVVRAEDVIVLPSGMPVEIAACLFVAHGTALHALRQRGELRAGETLAILGAAGGVGHAAIQLGKVLGARVVACVGSKEKLAFAAAQGADETVNYAEENLRDRLKCLSGGSGVDVVLDLVGGPYSEQALRAIASGGRYLVAGFAAGEIPRLPLNLVLLRSCDVRGVMLGEPKGKASSDRVSAATLIAWYAEGKIRPHVDATYPLDATAQALDAIAARRTKGRIVVKPQVSINAF